ncbi:hypothetical protein D3C83_86590 [compost metagenome]
MAKPMRRSRERLAADPWTSLMWCSDISPGSSITSTAFDSSTSTAISCPRVSRLFSWKVSTWAAIAPACVPGMTFMHPLSTLLPESATHAVTTSCGSRPQ